MLLTTIFYHADNFCKDLNKELKSRTLETEKTTGPKPRLTQSEMLTIVIFFHHSCVMTFKDYYAIYVKGINRRAFPTAPSYNRFKVFKGFAARGKISTGWFYGFKLHLVINDQGEIIAFDITPGNSDDRNTKTMDHLRKTLWGKLFGDKGDLSATLFKHLFSKGVTLFTKLKRGIKNTLISIADKLLLKKRGVIESVNAILKSSRQIEHSRHRSSVNFFVNLIAGLVAYSFRDKKR